MSDVTNNPIQRHRRAYWLGLMLFVMGITLTVRSCGSVLQAASTIATRTTVPGEVTYKHLPRGEYTLYGHLPQEMAEPFRDADAFQRAARRWRFAMSAPDGKPVELTETEQDDLWNEAQTGSPYVPLYNFVVKRQGSYLLTVAAPPAPEIREFEVLIGPSLRTLISQGLFKLGMILVWLCCVFIGLIMALVTFANRPRFHPTTDEAIALPGPVIAPEHRRWAALCHLSPMVALIGFPFGNLLGPLALWLMKRNEDPYIDIQGKEALNFQISLMIYLMVSALLSLIVIGLFLIVLIPVYAFVIMLMASVKASYGEAFRYPLTIRLIH